MSTLTELQSGTRLGSYEIIAAIGAGGPVLRLHCDLPEIRGDHRGPERTAL